MPLSIKGPADKERFFWLTQNQFLASLEAQFLHNIKINKNDAVLEIGCGEGADIYNLQNTQAKFTGIDLCPAKLQFAAQYLKNARFICADAVCLPFPDNLFDLVFCRDVLHHVQDKDRMLREMHRVLKPGKPLILIEANAANPFWFIFGSLVRQERGVKQNSVEAVNSLLQRLTDAFRELRIDYLNYPIFIRLLTHYKFGIRLRAFSRILERLYNNYLSNTQASAAKRCSPYLMAYALKR